MYRQPRLTRSKWGTGCVTVWFFKNIRARRVAVVPRPGGRGWSLGGGGLVLRYGEPLVDGSAELGPLEEEEVEEDGLWLGKVKVVLGVTDDMLAAEDAATDAGFWANRVPDREKGETVRIKPGDEKHYQVSRLLMMRVWRRGRVWRTRLLELKLLTWMPDPVCAIHTYNFASSLEGSV